jgi:SAM-dependent methyltransferase
MTVQSEARYTSFPRYLAAKKSVDDRALNQHVWDHLGQLLADKTTRTTTATVGTKPLQVVEIGAGIGTMVERILERGLLTTATYTLVDAIAENIVEAKRRLPAWAKAAGFSVQQDGADPAIINIARVATTTQPAIQLQVHLITADCFDFAAQTAQQGAADLLITHAFLDLIDIPRSLPKLKAILKPTGLLYATINFDGNTILQPEIDRPFDNQIEAAYHATMDARITAGLPSGDSRTGRHLFGQLPNAGFTVLDAGASDWIVFAGRDGYPADESYFLHFIVDTMYGALCDHPTLDQTRLAAWIKKRHAQIERGDLVYIAHQLDFLAQMV